MGDVARLTIEQKERITRNFKAAKLIRDRKRTQMSTNLLSTVTASPSLDSSLGGRFSVNGFNDHAVDMKTPVLKKTKNGLSHGILPRKALTEVKQNRGTQPLYVIPSLKEQRNLGKEFSKQMNFDQEILHRHEENCDPLATTVGIRPSVSYRSVCPPPLQPIAKSTDIGDEATGIFESCSQTFSEEMLKEIDTLCEQRNSTESGARQSSNAGSKPERLNQDQDQHLRLPWPGAIPGKQGVRRLQGLAENGSEPEERLSPGHSSVIFNRTSSMLEDTECHLFETLGSMKNSNLDLKHKVGPSSSTPQLNTAGTNGPSNVTRECIVSSPTVPSNIAVNQAKSSSHLQSLNASQRNAVTSDTTMPLLILAGPGSGKTSTMVARLVTLLKEGVHASNILAMTFTTAAATEMRERIAKAVGKAVAKDLAISTFHSFSLQLCRSHAAKLGRTSEFLVFGPGQQRKAVIEATRIALDERRVDQSTNFEENKKYKDVNVGNMTTWKDQARKWQQFVTRAKCAGKTAEDYMVAGNVLGASVLTNYEKTLAACDALDYHDFITSAVNLLQEDREVFEECQKQWTCILVDEFQDTSAMQHRLLRLLASHNRITVVGDDDQSIFGFNGACTSGFDSFRKDFPGHKEVRLYQNYRSSKCIVEAAAALINNNLKRTPTGHSFTDNADGERIQVRECRNEEAQCSLVVDYLLMNNSSSSDDSTYGSTAILYRRQVTGKLFQTTFRARNIPFNVHGVAFYRKKVIKSIIALLWTSIPGRKDIFSKRAFKSLYNGNKAEIAKVLGYIEKISTSKKCDFLEAAKEIFEAKTHPYFDRRQLAFGRKILVSIKTLKHVVAKEQSLSAIIKTAASLLPQRPNFDKRAVIDEDGGKLLNEDNDPRTILEFLLDDVNDFLSTQYAVITSGQKVVGEAVESLTVLKAFLDHLMTREDENFRCRRQENNNSLTLTTMHQSKGLEWDNVFIVNANDTETPLLHESLGCATEASMSLEEERRLFYVAMTRARKNLYITYIVVDSKKQVLQPSRFIREIPRHLLDNKTQILECPMTIHSSRAGSFQNGVSMNGLDNAAAKVAADGSHLQAGAERAQLYDHGDCPPDDVAQAPGSSNVAANAFLKRFSVEKRSVVAVLFHTWAKKPCFQDPNRLLSKVGFVIDERLRLKGNKNKDVLMSLKLGLKDEAALSYAQHVLAWEKLPAEDRAIIQAERQEHFQQQNCERSLASATATPKQVAYLKSLGCTVEPTSRLHASKLIEQYKKL